MIRTPLWLALFAEKPYASCEVVASGVRRPRTIATLLCVLLGLGALGWATPATAQTDTAGSSGESGSDAQDASSSNPRKPVAGPDTNEPPRPVKLPGLDTDPLKQLMDEIARNMKTIEALLNRRETGGQCQDLQAATVRKIDELIEELQKQSSCSSSGSCSSGQPQPGQQGQASRSGDQQRSESQRQLEERAAQQRKQPGGSSGDPESTEKVPNNETREVARPARETEGELRERAGVGRWGRLPGKVVEQMYDNGKRKLPERYRVLLEEYFRRLPLSEGQ